jgi:hypothetical protein
VVKTKSESLAAVRDEDEHPVVPIDASAGQLLALYEPLDIDRLVREELHDDDGETGAERPAVSVRTGRSDFLADRMTRHESPDRDPPVCESRAVVAARRDAPG